MSTDLAAPLADRAELASRDWIRVAGGFLATQNGHVSGLNAPFKCSSEFTNPPPHLARDRESIAYTITFASDGITIDDTLDPGADRFQTADYNSALPFAWLVHRDNEDIGRLIHEYEHLFGDKVDGPIQRTPTPTAVQAILNDLHDHMAVRTINNPDIEHRARYLGLSNNLADLDDVGYTVMPGAFTASYADALRAETHRNHAGREEGASFRATMLLKRGRIWEEAVIHPWVLTVVEYLIAVVCCISPTPSSRQRARKPTPAFTRTMALRESRSPFPNTAWKPRPSGRSMISTRSTDQHASSLGAFANAAWCPRG